ncbi:MAG: Uma2 family endonuclease [Gemmataceae bacterium]
MATMTMAPPPPALAPLPRPVYWTAEAFHDLCDAGIFRGRKVILVDGVIIEMPLPNPEHDYGVIKLNRFLMRTFDGNGCYVRNQQGFDAALDTDPGPDLAVVPGDPEDHRHVHPTTAILVIEVANTSLAYDRGVKGHIYAAAGVPEYWVLDVIGRQLLVFRDPVADPAAPRGHRYTTALTVGPADSVSPQAAAQATVKVADLLP